jgi:hypothetical protein
MTRKELEKMDDDELDGLIPDIKPAEAAEINNRGREAQISYILA